MKNWIVAGFAALGLGLAAIPFIPMGSALGKEMNSFEEGCLPVAVLAVESVDAERRFQVQFWNVAEVVESDVFENHGGVTSQIRIGMTMARKLGFPVSRMAPWLSPSLSSMSTSGASRTRNTSRR